jgi:hypothetical protein
MDHYLHRVLGFYESTDTAWAACQQLIVAGVLPRQLNIMRPHGLDWTHEEVADSDDVLKAVLVDGAVGTGVGALAGAGVTVALAAVATGPVTLLVAGPVLGALAMVGWGASLGGLLGAMVGAEGKKGEVSDLIKDALANGHVVLVAHTHSESETELVKRLISESIQVDDATLPPPPPLAAALHSRA